MSETLLLIPLVLKHPWSPLWSTFRIRVDSLAGAVLLAQALRARIARHELN